jgi:hypothetical protein
MLTKISIIEWPPYVFYCTEVLRWCEFLLPFMTSWSSLWGDNFCHQESKMGCHIKNLYW